MISFELAQAGDAQVLCDIAIKAFAEDKKLYGSTPEGIESVEWHRSQTGSQMYYKILSNADSVGGLRVFKMEDGHYRLGSVFIHPDFQNQGIGCKAMEFIEGLFPDAVKWSLDTPFKNFRNHYFYEKHGFRKVGETKPFGDDSFILFEYEKEAVPS
ncbi:MAG: GNAT family N-acetyltransferase [Spirochaetia bacterium]